MIVVLLAGEAPRRVIKIRIKYATLNSGGCSGGIRFWSGFAFTHPDVRKFARLFAHETYDPLV